VGHRIDDRDRHALAPPGATAAGRERDREPGRDLQRHRQLGREVETAVGHVEDARILGLKVAGGRIDREVERQSAELQLAQAVGDLGQLALGRSVLAGLERLALIDDHRERLRPPVGRGEGVRVDEGAGVLLLAALELAEEVVVRVLVDVDDGSESAGQPFRGVLPDHPVFVLRNVAIVEDLVDDVARGPLGRRVAELGAGAQVPLLVTVEVKGEVRARTQHLVVGEAEHSAVLVGVPDVRDQEPRRALGLRGPDHVRPVEDRHLLHPHPRVRQVRIAADLDLGLREPEAPVRRRVAGAAGQHAVFDLERLLAGLGQDLAAEVLVGLGERRRLPEGARLGGEVEVGALCGHAPAHLVEDHVALRLDRHRVAVEDGPLGLEGQVPILDLDLAAQRRLVLARGLDRRGAAGDGAAAFRGRNLELEGDAVLVER
jgi:hypothetical protein